MTVEMCSFRCECFATLDALLQTLSNENNAIYQNLQCIVYLIK